MSKIAIEIKTIGRLEIDNPVQFVRKIIDTMTDEEVNIVIKDLKLLESIKSPYEGNKDYSDLYSTEAMDILKKEENKRIKSYVRASKNFSDLLEEKYEINETTILNSELFNLKKYMEYKFDYLCSQYTKAKVIHVFNMVDREIEKRFGKTEKVFEFPKKIEILQELILKHKKGNIVEWVIRNEALKDDDVILEIGLEYMYYEMSIQFPENALYMRKGTDVKIILSPDNIESLIDEGAIEIII